MRAMEILVVEDSAEFRQVVLSALQHADHRVHVASTIREAEELLASLRPDLVVLDLTLPDGDGLDLCRSIRDRSDAYILMLTARDDEVDKVVGFRLGADDYVTKPFSPREFAARVDALGRRPRTPMAESEERVVDDLLIRPMAREVSVGGVAVDLTRIEFDLLDRLTVNPREVVTRLRLVEAVWGEDWFGDDHVVDVHIANLRKKLATVTDRKMIRTVRGVGYGMAS